MYLVFTTNWGHKNKNYLQIRNNNNNVYTIKICGMYKLYNKTMGNRQVIVGWCRLKKNYMYPLESSKTVSQAVKARNVIIDHKRKGFQM